MLHTRNNVDHCNFLMGTVRKIGSEVKCSVGIYSSKAHILTSVTIQNFITCRI